jgi:hypothetical protein
MSNAPGLSRRDTYRSIVALDELRGFASGQGWMVVGSLTERHYLARRGFSLPDFPFGGIDLAMPGGLESALPGYQSLISGYERYFYVDHCHPDEGYLVLVHKQTAVKVTVHPARHDVPSVSTELAEGYAVPMQTLPEQIVSVVEDVLQLDAGLPIEYKQIWYMNALVRLLAGSVELTEATEAAWLRRHSGLKEGNLFHNLGRARRLGRTQLQLVQSSRYDRITGRLSRLKHRCPGLESGTRPRLTPFPVIALATATRQWRTPILPLGVGD